MIPKSIKGDTIQRGVYFTATPTSTNGVKNIMK